MNSRTRRQRGAGLAGAFLFFAFAPAQAEWQVSKLDQKPCELPTVEYRHYSLGRTDGERTEVQLALFSPKKARLRVIDQPEMKGDLAATMTRERCVAGVNGGYFDPDGAPIGLRRSDGKTVNSLQHARLLSGVLAVGLTSVELFRTRAFPEKRSWRAALQCGPFLLEKGKPVAGLNNTRRARRTFVATISDRQAAIGFCEPVTLAQLAEVLAALSDLKPNRAMNLDGGSSSAFWCRTKNGTVSISERKPVRDFLALAPASR